MRTIYVLVVAAILGGCASAPASRDTKLEWQLRWREGAVPEMIRYEYITNNSRGGSWINTREAAKPAPEGYRTVSSSKPVHNRERQYLLLYFGDTRTAHASELVIPMLASGCGTWTQWVAPEAASNDDGRLSARLMNGESLPKRASGDIRAVEVRYRVLLENYRCDA